MLEILQSYAGESVLLTVNVVLVGMFLRYLQQLQASNDKNMLAMNRRWLLGLRSTQRTMRRNSEVIGQANAQAHRTQEVLGRLEQVMARFDLLLEERQREPHQERVIK